MLDVSLLKYIQKGVNGIIPKEQFQKDCGYDITVTRGSQFLKVIVLRKANITLTSSFFGSIII